MTAKKWRVAGHVLSVLLSVFLLAVSAPGKFVDFKGKDEMFEKLGFSYELMRNIGVLEVTLAVLFLIPRTGFIGAILLTGYLGGATLTHLRVGEPFFFPIVLGVVMWIAYGLRRLEIFRLAAGAPLITPIANAPTSGGDATH